MNTLNPLWGYDLSLHQKRPSQVMLWREGFDVAGMKMTEGYTYKDPDGAYNLGAATRAGMIRMPYHFLWAGKTLIAARSFYESIKSVTDPTKVALCVDVESHAGNPADQPKWADVYSFVGHLRDLVGGDPHIIIYTGHWWRDVIRQPIRNLPGPDDHLHLWLSRYVNDGFNWASVLYQGMPQGWWELTDTGGQKPIGIQFTDKANTKAVSPVDANAWALPYERMRVLSGLPPARREPLVPYNGYWGDREWLNRGTRRMVRDIEYRFPVQATTYEGHGRPGKHRSADFPITRAGQMPTAAQKAVGDRITEYLRANWVRFDLDYIIWWNMMREEPDEAPFSYEPLRLDWLRNHGGSEDVETSRHYDHPHVSRKPTAV